MEEFLLRFVEHLGYIGIFFTTLIESTFVPIPAEVTVVPAGMLAAKGHFSYWGVLASATMGVIAGSAINYWIGSRYGRVLIIKFGKYVFLKPSFLRRTEIFFEKYGAFAVFIGRLLPGLRHYIGFVAGIAKMKFQLFVIYTSLGGLIWMWILLQVGYMAEKNSAKGNADLSSLELIVIAVTVITLIAYFIKKKIFKH